MAVKWSRFASLSWGRSRFGSLIAVLCLARADDPIFLSQTFSDASTRTVFNNMNTSGVQNHPTKPTKFTLRRTFKITQVLTYHYFNSGALPGTLGFRTSSGQILGPWATYGTPGQGGVPNAHWIAEPFVVVQAGTYTIADSDPTTWSHNSISDGAGFARIEGLPW